MFFSNQMQDPLPKGDGDSRLHTQENTRRKKRLALLVCPVIIKGTVIGSKDESPAHYYSCAVFRIWPIINVRERKHIY